MININIEEINDNLLNIKVEGLEKNILYHTSFDLYSPLNITRELLLNLLNDLIYYDDILLIFNNKTIQLNQKYKLMCQYKTKLFEHQEQAILYGLQKEHKNWLLLDQPGLGKSKTIINLAEELKEQKGLQHCLIICGINTLKQNWKKEVSLHSNQTCRIIGEKISKKGKITYSSIKERANELIEPLESFFYILNVECLRSEDIINAIKKSKNKIDMIVIDEAHKCKGTHAQQSHGLMQLKNTKYKIALSGTLILNNPLDAYLPLKFIGVENATLTNFKSQYCQFGGFGGYQITGYKNLDILKEEIESCSLRRTKQDLKMKIPPKTVITEEVEMNDDHKKFYENIIDGVKEECDKIDLKPNNVLALTTRLRQASTCPSILTTNKISSSKIDRTLDLVEEIIGQGDKVVILSTFKEPIRELNELLKEYNPLCGTGDQKDEEVSRNIDLFQTNPKYKVFLGTVAKVGTGVTLNAATYLISLDCPWTSALQEQAEDRIHRVTNKEPVTIYRLVCKGTIDEMVAKLLDTKKAFSDYIIDDKVDQKTVDILKQYIEDL